MKTLNRICIENHEVVETEFGTITGRTQAGEDFVDLFAESCEQARQREKLFIKYVRSLGAVAAVKNDGWIKREEKKFQVASYAYFDYGIKEGDLVAIGDPYNYKMVVITEVEKTWWRANYYHFRDKVL